MREQVKKLLEDTLIVIVLYKVPLDQSTTWGTLEIEYPCTIFVYDNSPWPQKLPSAHHKIIYRHDPENPGVAKAYNEAYRQCAQLGKQWLLLLDQDTSLARDLFPAYAKAITAFPEERVFAPVLRDDRGILSPFLYKAGMGKRAKKLGPGIHSLHSMRVANSGFLAHLSAFEWAGGYDLDLPLDFSDIYFQEKLLSHISTFIVVEASIAQDFSGTKFKGKDQAQARYESFCKSSVTMGDKTGLRANFHWVSLKRAFHLSFRYATLKFFFRHFYTWSGR